MKNRLILFLKVLAWVPILILVIILFLPIWLITGENTFNWFEKYDDSFYSDEDEPPSFNPPSFLPPTGGSGVTDLYPETPVDRPRRY